MQVKTWHVEVFIDEIDGRTDARAVLHTGVPEHKEGRGVALLSPHDADVPEIGDEVATARALHSLADALLGTAADDISGFQDEPVHLDFGPPLGANRVVVLRSQRSHR
jgi:hypothetical protein